MIVLNRVNGQEILINSDYIKSVDEDNGTTVTMSVGDKIEVKETAVDITELIEARGFVPEKDREPAKKQSKKPTRSKKPELPKNVSHEF